LIGFGFAALALCLSVVSFPLMLDRNPGLVPAVAASLSVSRENPVPVALWAFSSRWRWSSARLRSSSAL